MSLNKFFQSRTAVRENGCIEIVGRGGSKKTLHCRTMYLGKVFGSHRLSYEMHVGPTMGLQVCHRCDNPPCVNPEHLFLGTQKDNMIDKVRKGRHPNRHGAGNPGAKLNNEIVRQIREAAASGERYRDIAERFGSNHADVSNIARGLAWKNAPGPIVQKRTQDTAMRVEAWKTRRLNQAPSPTTQGTTP